MMAKTTLATLLALASSALAGPALTQLLAGANWSPTPNFDALHVPNVMLPTSSATTITWSLGSAANPDDYVSISLIAGCDSNSLSPYPVGGSSNVNGIITDVPIKNSVGTFDWHPTDVGSFVTYGLIIAVVNSATDPNDYKTDPFTFQYSNAFYISGNGADPASCGGSSPPPTTTTTTTTSATTTASSSTTTGASTTTTVASASTTTTSGSPATTTTTTAGPQTTTTPATTFTTSTRGPTIGACGA